MAYFASFSDNRSSGGASKTTVGIDPDGVEAEPDAPEVEADAPSFETPPADADPDDLTESDLWRLLAREPDPDPLLAERR